MSGSYGLPLTSLDYLAIEVKTRLLAATEIAGYRTNVERVADVGGKLFLRPGEILVTTIRLASDIKASHSDYIAGIGIILPFIEDSTPLLDSVPSPPSMIETFIAMIEKWRPFQPPTGLPWTPRGVEALIFESPYISGEDPATSLPLFAYLMVAGFQKVGKCGPT